MGYSLVAAFSILSISIFVALEIFSGQVYPIIEDFENSNSNMIQRYNDKIETDINITNVEVTANQSNYDYNITINNNGKITLDTNEINILINGYLYEPQCIESYLLPLNDSYFIIYNISDNGNVRLKAITENGVEDYFSISI